MRLVTVASRAFCSIRRDCFTVTTERATRGSPGSIGSLSHFRAGELNGASANAERAGYRCPPDCSALQMAPAP
jgi:hypothetical protein